MNIIRNAYMRPVIGIVLLLLATMASGQRKIRQVSFNGTGYSLGLQHGKTLKKEIGEIVARMKKNTTASLNKDAEQVFNAFFAYANFDASIKAYTPDLYDEIRGIAEGSGQAFRDIMVLNLLDEFWVYQDAVQKHHCSGLGVPSINGSPGYIAQNMDIETYTDGYQILMRLERTATRPEQHILTHPGLIALNGMNETGVGACMNTLMQLKASSSGLPVAFIVRHIINATDKAQILDFIQKVPHASGQNYILGIRGEVYDFEASANKVVRFNPNNSNGTVYHTNHPLVNDDMKPSFELFNPNAPNKPVLSNSFIRLASVQNRIAPAATIDEQLIMATLRSKDIPLNPVCRHPAGGGFTFGSVIMTLTGNPFMMITAGPPDETEYEHVGFSSK